MQVDAREIVKTVSEMARPFSDTLSDAWNALIGDRVAAYRLRNAAKLQPKVMADLAKLGKVMNPAKIPERYAVAWFEEATKQDEPEIQALFARLLANAAAGDEDAGDRRHLEIVSRFTPLDAKVMDIFYNGDLAKGHVSQTGELVEVVIDEWRLYQFLKEDVGNKAWQSVEHLLALGVVEKRTYISKDSVTRLLSDLQTDTSSGLIYPSFGSGSELEVSAEIVSTFTGLSLMRALSDPEKPKTV